MKEKIKILVVNNHTIGLQREGSNTLEVLHTSKLKGSPYEGGPLQAPIHIPSNADVRLATKQDFDDLRVTMFPKEDAFYEYIYDYPTDQETMKKEVKFNPVYNSSEDEYIHAKLKFNDHTNEWNASIDGEPTYFKDKDDAIDFLKGAGFTVKETFGEGGGVSAKNAEDIAKLKKLLDSNLVPEAVKAKAKEKIAELEAQKTPTEPKETFAKSNYKGEKELRFKESTKVVEINNGKESDNFFKKEEGIFGSIIGESKTNYKVKSTNIDGVEYIVPKDVVEVMDIEAPKKEFGTISDWTKGVKNVDTPISTFKEGDIFVSPSGKKYVYESHYRGNVHTFKTPFSKNLHTANLLFMDDEFNGIYGEKLKKFEDSEKSTNVEGFEIGDIYKTSATKGFFKPNQEYKIVDNTRGLIEIKNTNKDYYDQNSHRVQVFQDLIKDGEIKFVSRKKVVPSSLKKFEFNGSEDYTVRYDGTEHEKRSKKGESFEGLILHETPSKYFIESTEKINGKAAEYIVLKSSVDVSDIVKNIKPEAKPTPSTSGKRLKEIADYVTRRNIEYVKFKVHGKEYTVASKNIIDGLYIKKDAHSTEVRTQFKLGGNLSANHVYIANRYITEAVIKKDGKMVEFKGKDILDGIYVQKEFFGGNIPKMGAPKVPRTQFEEEEFEYGKGGKIPTTFMKIQQKFYSGDEALSFAEKIEIVRTLIEAGYTDSDLKVTAKSGIAYKNKVDKKAESVLVNFHKFYNGSFNNSLKGNMPFQTIYDIIDMNSRNNYNVLSTVKSTMHPDEFKDGGPISGAFDFNRFKLSELIHGYEDVEVARLVKDGSKYIQPEEINKKYKDFEFKLTNHGSVVVKKGSENYYLEIPVQAASTKYALGDEFTIVLYTKDNKDGLKTIANRIIEKFEKGVYVRPSATIKTTGIYKFVTKDKEYILEVSLFEKENDLKDSLQIQNELRGELGSILINNNAWRRLSKGDTVTAQSSKSGVQGKLTRLDDLSNVLNYFKKGGPITKKAKAAKFEKVMAEFKAGTLTSNGEKVTDRKQAIAIALSESGQSNK